MSPQQLASDDVCPKADVYSFGITMYECFSGQVRTAAFLMPSCAALDAPRRGTAVILDMR